MNLKDAIKLINDLITLSVKNENYIDKSNEPFKSFGIGNSNVSFVGLTALSMYQEGLEKLNAFNKEIEQTISLKKFEQNLISLIRFLRDNKKKCDAKDFQNSFNNLLAIKNTESEILYELFGAEMKGSTHTLGELTLYNDSLAEGILLEKYPLLQKRESFLDQRKSNIYLGVKVTARENNKAVEIADELVESFENVINYMEADLSHKRSIGVFNYRGWKNTSRIICNNSSISFSGSKDIALPIKIENPFYTDPSQGNNKVWFLITKKNKTEIEKRLHQSIEWIGKGVHDKDKSKALVQFVFAIEGMLQYDEKTIITPSIVSQLSDWLAFIIQDEPAKRKEIAKYFKQTYRKRSAIVHGGAKTIDIKDLEIALRIAKLMVISFLTKKPFCDLKTIQKLGEYINELKFK